MVNLSQLDQEMNKQFVDFPDFAELRDCFINEKFLSSSSQGRFGRVDEDVNQFSRRDCFRIDVDKIEKSKATRRLSDKTQVFCAPNNNYVRDRRKHTSEVRAINRYICDFLGLNADLGESEAELHDLGHWPFGHRVEQLFTRIKDGLPYWQGRA